MNNTAFTDRPAVILLVEDNDNDAELTKLGFAQSKLPAELHHVTDGEQCMQFLRKEKPHTNMPTPDLVLLDLHMPRMSGLEVLAAIGREENLMHLPVIVLTTSDAPSDVQAAYRLRCSSYIVKPVGFTAFAKTIEAVVTYWLRVAALPTPTALTPSSEITRESITSWSNRNMRTGTTA
jgi:two-component system, chemotaxis family, response regulator Rcp1